MQEIESTTSGGFYIARRYQKIQAMLPEIKAMLQKEKSQREVVVSLGL